jgi:hypothetical protein
MNGKDDMTEITVAHVTAEIAEARLWARRVRDNYY